MVSRDRLCELYSDMVTARHYQSFGVTGEIVASVADRDLGALDAVERVAVPDVPIPYARPMENEVIPDAGDIESRVREVVSPE